MSVKPRVPETTLLSEAPVSARMALDPTRSGGRGRGARYEIQSPLDGSTSTTGTSSTTVLVE